MELPEDIRMQIRLEEEYRQQIRDEIKKTNIEESIFKSPVFERLIFPMIVVGFTAALTSILVPWYLNSSRLDEHEQRIRVELLEDIMKAATRIENSFTTYEEEAISYWTIMNDLYLKYLKTILSEQEESLTKEAIADRRKGFAEMEARVTEKYFLAIDRLNGDVDEFNLWLRAAAVKLRFFFGQEERIANIASALEKRIEYNDSKLEQAIQQYRAVNDERGKRFRDEVLSSELSKRREELDRVFRETQTSIPQATDMSTDFKIFYTFIEDLSHLIATSDFMFLDYRRG